MKIRQLIMIAGSVLLISGCASTLQTSSSEGDLPEVNELIAEGADVNAKDDAGWTPIYYALQNNHRDVVETLIENGADLNVTDPNGQSPLSLAVVYSDIETVELLLAADAMINVSDSAGRDAAPQQRRHQGASGNSGPSDLVRRRRQRPQRHRLDAAGRGCPAPKSGGY